MIVSSADDYRAIARRRLPRFLFDYADGGAGAETTLARNVADLAAQPLRQRVLRGTETISLATRLFNMPLDLPVVLAPIGLAGMYARRGEVQAARAAAAAGVPFCLSTVSVCPLAEVAGASNGSLWLQLYMIRDRGFMRDLLAQARAIGVKALAFTVDMPAPGMRRRDAHAGLSGPYAGTRRLLQAAIHPRWAWNVGMRGRPHILGNIAPVLGGATGLEDFMGWIARNFDPAITWRDIEWVRTEWPGPLIVKGVLEADDAKAARDAGADGVVVSNHGGRQLDGAVSTVRALPAVAEAVGGQVVVLADSGVRSGADVVRMLALGADSVMLGRAWLWALAAGGEAAVRQLLDLIAAEMRTTMCLAGVTSLKSMADAVSDRA